MTMDFMKCPHCNDTRIRANARITPCSTCGRTVGDDEPYTNKEILARIDEALAHKDELTHITIKADDPLQSALEDTLDVLMKVREQRDKFEKLAQIAVSRCEIYEKALEKIAGQEALYAPGMACIPTWVGCKFIADKALEEAKKL